MPKHIANYIGFSSELTPAKGNNGVWNTIDQFFFKGRFEWYGSVGTILTVPASISSPGLYNLDTQGPLVITSTGIHTIGSISDNTFITVKLWGGGGMSGSPSQVGSRPGGGGGFTVGSINLTKNFNCVVAVGNTTGIGGPATTPADPTTKSGGYTGLFYNSISQSNSILISGGGGCPGSNDQGANGAGGGGGGNIGSDGEPLAPPFNIAPGKGGTQLSGGNGGTSSSPPAPGYAGSAGSALQGGNGGPRGGSGAGGGAGGGGYYGGGGGAGQASVNTGGGGGGGGSGYIGGHPAVPVSNALTIQASSRLSAGAPDPSYPLVGIAGSGSLFPGGLNGNGAVVISLTFP